VAVRRPGRLTSSRSSVPRTTSRSSVPRPVVLVGLGLSLLALGLITLFFPVGGGSAATAELTIAGPEQTIFDWTSDRCADDDIPDAPARAFRDYRGRIHLIAAHFETRVLTGSDLNQVRRSCRVIFGSHRNPDPADHDDREWLTAPYTPDGKNVFALVHNEYRGYEHPGRCPSGSVTKCWYNAVTTATSADGGKSFRHPPAPSHLVASIPYRYDPQAGPIGVFAPSNIVRRGDDAYLYSLLHVRSYREQPGGACLVRTRNVADRTSWRAWDGRSFAVMFTNPYRNPHAVSTGHICRPVANEQIGGMTQSLTYNTYLRKFVLVGTAGFPARGSSRPIWGFYYAFSDNLIEWDSPRLLAEVEFISTFRCGDRDPVLYPSLLDPASRSRNFETTGRRPYLYFVRFHYERCRSTLNRDLVRVPLVVSRPKGD
jgi:hypothetical protein